MKNLILAVACLITLSSCESSNGGGQVYVNDEPNVVVTPTTTLGDNLDLQALGELVKSCKTAEGIETKLNADSSINNLDLNGDGKVDYINVTEYGSGTTKGFSFTVDLGADGKQEVATVEIEKGATNANMTIHGNQQIYGQSSTYQSSFTLTNFLILNYLFSYHSMYYSPYRYGYYPGYYHSYGCSPMSSYRSRVSTTTRTTSFTKSSAPSKISSPNSSLNSKSVATRAQAMSTPTRSQKSFSSGSNEKPSTSGFKGSSSTRGGFGSHGSSGGGHSSGS